MPRSGWLTALALCALGAMSTGAAAHPVLPDDYVERPIVIAGDAPPPQPEPPPYVPPPDPPRQASIGLALGGMTYASDNMTPLEKFGPSGGMGIVHVSHREEPGFEALMGATGSERGRSYSLTVRLVIGARLQRKNLARPFLAIGPAFAIARLAETDMKGAGSGLGIGPSGAIGLHGFLSHRVYWRASAGFVGAGIGTFSTDLGLGWVIDK